MILQMQIFLHKSNESAPVDDFRHSQVVSAKLLLKMNAPGINRWTGRAGPRATMSDDPHALVNCKRLCPFERFELAQRDGRPGSGYGDARPPL